MVCRKMIPKIAKSLFSRGVFALCKADLQNTALKLKKAKSGNFCIIFLQVGKRIIC